MPNTNRPEDTSKKRLFCDTVARPVPGGWELMNRQEGGWSASSIFFATIIEICQEFDVRVGKGGEDKHGRYIEIKVVRP